jgi:pimeloyl-ACP methyl ester carboxylesterase
MVNTYVMIHGAWHGGWAWQPIAKRLRAEGHTVLTPTMPGLTGLDDPTNLILPDVIDFVVDLFAGRDLRDIILVAHSWGGSVAVGAAPRVADRLKKLVFWNAFIPGGLSLYHDTHPDYRPVFDGLAAESANNTIHMPYDLWRSTFIQDASEEVARLTHELLVPQPLQYFTHSVEPIDVDKLGLPISYVLSEEDLGLPMEGEYGHNRFYERLKVRPIMAPGSHEALFTRPGDLAELFRRASDTD